MKGIVLLRILKKKFIALLVALILCFIGCFSECTKGTTEVDFYEFAKEYCATEFYEMCEELVYVVQGTDENGDFWNIESGITEYHYNLDKSLLWIDATMVKICYYSKDGYKAIKQTMLDTWELRKLAEEYAINGIDSTVYYVGDTEHEYGEYKDFGFVALCDEKDCIYFFWFYDQDYDGLVNSEATFDEFYKLEFDWFEEQ